MQKQRCHIRARRCNCHSNYTNSRSTELTKYDAFTFHPERWLVVARWVSAGLTQTGWTIAVRCSSFPLIHHWTCGRHLKYNSNKQSHHLSQSDFPQRGFQQFLSRIILVWSRLSSSSYPLFPSPHSICHLQDYISLIANSLFLYLATLVQVFYFPCLPTAGLTPVHPIITPYNKFTQSFPQVTNLTTCGWRFLWLQFGLASSVTVELVSSSAS